MLCPAAPFFWGTMAAQLAQISGLAEAIKSASQISFTLGAAKTREQKKRPALRPFGILPSAALQLSPIIN